MFFKRWIKGGRQLIDEVSALEKPKMFHPRPIDEIIGKYVSYGMSAREVKSVLSTQGLKIYEVKAKDVFPNCLDCDEVAISAWHKFGSFISIFPTRYSVVVRICFKGGVVSLVDSWYVSHAY